ncbi:MAG: hypothetical protein Q4F00_01135 [bacterium]|nr:hypothetical protein [bacterium]
MTIRVSQLKCPSCGWPLELGMTECPAGHPVYISTFNSINDLPLPLLNRYASAYRKNQAAAPLDRGTNKSLAFCYLKLKLYEQALDAFAKAIADNFDDSEVYFYAAIAALKGKKAFVTPRPMIDQALEYVSSALIIEPRGIYYYLQAYIKYDYFARKHLRISPDYRQCLEQARGRITPADITALFALLNVEKPEILTL